MENNKNIEKIRHSFAHILAHAVKNLHPEVKFGMGPAIENGFYYDFEFVEVGANPREKTRETTRICPEDLPKIEKEMRKLISQNLVFEKKEVSKEEAQELFKDQPYKLELIEDLSAEVGPRRILMYGCGDFVDLCSGPHIALTKELDKDAFKLTKIAGAYWKGDEKNKMLTRIYGAAFENKKKLQEYLNLLEEMKKRDHRKLGKELDLFCFSDLVGPGLPLFTPKGVTIKEELQKRVESICRDYGFEKVITPHLAKTELYDLSGHSKKFADELFHVSSSRGHKFVLKPVQCPHQAQIYASKKRSYKELPIRYMESEKQYRAEKPGEVGGLTRVYAITVEDGHSFCTTEQVKKEIKIMVKIIKDFYKSLGLWKNTWVYLSLRDYSHPEKYIGEKNDWDTCEKILKEVCEEMKLNGKVVEGEAALYGPKIDFMFKDSLGKEIQIPTVQIDFATPKRFKLAYTDKDGKEKTPVMVHRAILGSYERFMALIIEHFAGAFPFWLSPVQVWVMPISISQKKYAKEITGQLKSEGLRVELKDENETIGKKIREAEMQKIPYSLIVGEKEVKSKTVSVRERKKGDIGKMKIKKFIEKIR